MAPMPPLTSLLQPSSALEMEPSWMRSPSRPWAHLLPPKFEPEVNPCKWTRVAGGEVVAFDYHPGNRCETWEALKHALRAVGRLLHHGCDAAACCEGLDDKAGAAPGRGWSGRVGERRCWIVHFIGPRKPERRG